MAFNSSLRIRDSLLWETQYIGFHEASNEFSLDKTEWKIVTLAQHFSPTNGDFIINLKGVKNILPSQPIMVETFLQDRRSKERMYCSRINISSSCETLYKGKLWDTCQRIPGLKSYEELTVVLTFYPSTILPTVRHKTPKLRIQRSLIFQTRKPAIGLEHRSPQFQLVNSSWNLIIRNVTTSSTLYQIILNNFSRIKSFEPFEVTTYIEDKRSHAHILCSNIIVTSTVEVLYKSDFNSVFEQIPALTHCDDLMIVCVFSHYVDSTLGVNTGTRLIEEYFNEPSFPNHFCNFLSLSKDFSDFAGKNLLTDIQVRCGDEVITAHKAVLAARSDVFLAMFQHNMVERRDKIIDIRDIEAPVFKVFLNYLYSGQLPKGLSADIIWKLYEASDKYAVPRLQDLCKWLMSRNVNTNNYVHYLKLANSHSDQQLNNAVANFVIERPYLMANATWLNFSQELPNVANEIYRRYMTKHVSS